MPNKNPKVSVYIANYNHGCFNDKAIQSVFDLTFYKIHDEKASVGNEHPHLQAFGSNVLTSLYQNTIYRGLRLLVAISAPWSIRWLEHYILALSMAFNLLGGKDLNWNSWRNDNYENK